MCIKAVGSLVRQSLFLSHTKHSKNQIQHHCRLFETDRNSSHPHSTRQNMSYINGFSTIHDPEVQMYKRMRAEYLRQQQRRQQEERERRIDLDLPVSEGMLAHFSSILCSLLTNGQQRKEASLRSWARSSVFESRGRASCKSSRGSAESSKR